MSFWHVFHEGMFTRGKSHTGNTFDCPFMLCPSNQPVDGAKKAKMKFIQVIAPRVHQYRCLHCGCLLNKGFDGPAVPETHWAQNINPKLVSNKPNFDFRNW